MNKIYEYTVAETAADNKWLFIEITLGYVFCKIIQKWVKADSIPNYKKLKPGDKIKLSYVNNNDRPVVRRGTKITTKCETTIF